MFIIFDKIDDILAILESVVKLHLGRATDSMRACIFYIVAVVKKKQKKHW